MTSVFLSSESIYKGPSKLDETPACLWSFAPVLVLVLLTLQGLKVASCSK